MRLTIALMVFGGSLAQNSVVPALGLGGITPDLPFIMTVLLALRRGPEAGCVVGFCAGLLQDVAGGGLLGVQALSKALAGFGMGLVGGRLLVENPLVQVPGLVLLTVAEGILRFGLLQLFHYPASLGELMVHVILRQALYNGVLGAGCLVAVAVLEAMRERLSWR